VDDGTTYLIAEEVCRAFGGGKIEADRKQN
jgi:hypothetical protein